MQWKSWPPLLSCRKQDAGVNPPSKTAGKLEVRIMIEGFLSADRQGGINELLSYIESGRVKYQDNRDIGCLIQKCGFLGKFYYPCREDAQMDCAPY